MLLLDLATQEIFFCCQVRQIVAQIACYDATLQFPTRTVAFLCERLGDAHLQASENAESLTSAQVCMRREIYLLVCQFFFL